MSLPPFRPVEIPPTVRLFPLPTVVFFPHTFLPLQIFEPRYRQMVKDAMEGDRFIAVVLLRPDHEPIYLENPPVHDVAGLGRIARYTPFPDGRSSIVLEGVARVRIGETVSDQPYRTVRAVRLEESPPTGEAAMQVRLAARLVGLYGQVLGPEDAQRENLQRLIVDPLGLGPLSDLLAATTNLLPHEHQALLEELDPVKRARSLVRLLRDRRVILRILESPGEDEGEGDPSSPPTAGPG